MIAATALIHRLTVATRNKKDFVKAGVRFWIRSSRSAEPKTDSPCRTGGHRGDQHGVTGRNPQRHVVSDPPNAGRLANNVGGFGQVVP